MYSVSEWAEPENIRQSRIGIRRQSYTVTQLERLWRRAWVRMTVGDGYQMFGYDWRTIALTKPRWYEALRAIYLEIKEAQLRQGVAMGDWESLLADNEATK